MKRVGREESCQEGVWSGAYGSMSLDGEEGRKLRPSSCGGGGGLSGR